MEKLIPSAAKLSWSLLINCSGVRKLPVSWHYEVYLVNKDKLSLVYRIIQIFAIYYIAAQTIL
jgi:hypothetical protein